MSVLSRANSAVALWIVISAVLMTTMWWDGARAVGSVEVDERLGETIPLDIMFADETGDSVTIGSLIERPTILSLVYFSCPMVCLPLLDELEKTVAKLDNMKTVAGEDYDVLTVSFDEFDKPEDAAKLKRLHLSRLRSGFPPRAWRFLTGTPGAIDRLTAAVGFRFARRGDGFVHPTTLVVLSPKGKVTRYLLGDEYLPLDVKMAIYEASEGRTGPTIAKFVRFCFNYDPEGRRYVLSLTRIVGTGVILALVGFILVLTRTGRKRPGASED